MTSSSPALARPRHVAAWISAGATTAYVLASLFFLRDTDGSLFPVLWIVIGIATIAVVVTGAVLSARVGRERVREPNPLERENHDLAALSETRRQVLVHIVDSQLAAILHGSAPPSLPDVTDDVSIAVLGRAAAHMSRIREDQRALKHAAHAAQAAVVSLSRKVQALAHRIQEEAGRMVQRHQHDPEVLETGMRVDHAAAQQARLAQSLAALCGEWPGQQWQEALPLADAVYAAAGRITAYKRVEVSGAPGVAVSASVVEPLIHVVAELLANATQSSPPATQVLVSLRPVQRGTVIEIDDGGVGVNDSRLDALRQIASGRRPVGLADLGEIPQTGLPVVGNYVRRHGFRVDLAESVYGGIRAVVLVPVELTEPLAPPGVGAGGVHALARHRSEPPVPLQPGPEAKPATTEFPDWHGAPARWRAPTTDDRPTPAVTPPAGSLAARGHPAASNGGQNATGELPALPQRRSRRGEAGQAARPTSPPSAQSIPSAEEAGRWMGDFMRKTPTSTNPADTREEQP